VRKNPLEAPNDNLIAHITWHGVVAATIDAPQQRVQNIAMLRLPEQADRRLQQSMDSKNEGLTVSVRVRRS